jgi:hypothetical protein
MTTAYMNFKRQASTIKVLANEGRSILDGLSKYLGLESKVSEHFKVNQEPPYSDGLRVSLHGVCLQFRFYIKLTDQNGEGIISVCVPASTADREVMICEKSVIKLTADANEVSYIKDSPHDLPQYAKDKVNDSILLAVSSGLAGKQLALGLK